MENFVASKNHSQDAEQSCSMWGSYYENIFRLRFSGIPISNTSHKDRTVQMENRCPLFYQIPLHNYIPCHSSAEMRHCDGNHLLKKDLPCKPAQRQLSRQGVDQQIPLTLT